MALALGSLCGYLLISPFASAETRIQLTDVTEETGISFRHYDGSSGRYYIVETMSAGLALFDFDNDGDVDIYFLNGAPQPGATVKDQPRNALYRNDGNWRFTDVTKEAGVGDPGHGLGVTVGDYDNDGYQDLYLNNYGPNVLYRNQGNGTFVNVTEAAQVANGDRVGAGTCFLDMDGDGDLDLYVANYVKFNHDIHVPRTKQGYPIYGNPGDYEAEPDTLYRNNGDGTFTDVSLESGVAAHPGPGMGMVCTDYDNDADTDVCVVNDGQANLLLQNDGSGSFKDVGLSTGFAYDHAGNVHASMGVDAADFDNDGFPDLHTTSYQLELATLYKNIRGNLFADVTIGAGAARGTRTPVTWGNGFVDFDNDGDRDIFIACGHLNDKLHLYDQTTTYETPNVILENLGQGKFADVSAGCGTGLAIRASSRGAAFDDLDNDGDVDVVILNSRKQPSLLRNDSATSYTWVDLQLQGTASSRDGVGARVELLAGELKLVDEVHSGRGYQGHFGSRLHFGLGRHKRVDQVTVRWVGGKTDIWKDLPVNKRLVLKEPSPERQRRAAR